jgi:Lipocalin-like domain
MPSKTPLLLAAAATLALIRPLYAQSSMVGIWFSPFQPDEPNVMSVIEFSADGTFHEEFRKCDNGDFVGYQTESGTWTVTGDVEHIRADQINGSTATAEADYKILMLSDTERRIRMDPQGYVFIGHRVTKFDFPDCPNGA